MPKHPFKKNLRPVLPWMCEKLPSLTLGAKICDNCRKKLAQISEPVSAPEEHGSNESGQDDPSASSQVEEDVFCAQESLDPINQCLGAIGETPIVRKKLDQVRYPKEKLKKITATMKKMMLPEEESSGSDNESEIIKQLKDKFQASTTNSEKVQVLTVLPKSWSVRKVQSEFGAPNYMARKAKQLVKQKGVLSTPNPRTGHGLAVETLDVVRRFYKSDAVSRVMPGRKDFVSARQAGGRVHIQKRLVLSNLREVYQLFKETYPTTDIGFSKLLS